MKRLLTILAGLCLALITHAPALAEEYSAQISYAELFQTPEIVGEVSVAGQNAVLDLDLGQPGRATIWILRDQHQVYVAAHALQAYAMFDFYGDATSFPRLLAQLAGAAMPLSLPVLSFTEISSKPAGSEYFGDELITIQQCNYLLQFLNNTWQVEAFVWEPRSLQPLAWKIEGIRSNSAHPDDYELIGPRIELVNIIHGPQNPTRFEPPTHYRQMYSVVDLLFAALLPYLTF